MQSPRSVRPSARAATRPELHTIIRTADPADLPFLALVLGRALNSDPIFQWLFGGAGSTDDIAKLAQRIYAEPTKRGMVWEAGDRRAVAVWIPPGVQVVNVTPTPGSELPREARGKPSAEATWTWIETYVPDDVWYLEVLGVDPDAQGAGLGGALIQHGLGLATAAGTGAFLETSVGGNVPYYERFGFEVVDEQDMPGEGPHVWFMRFDPSFPAAAD